MGDLVIEHALKNAWAAPNQDFQHNIELVRITPNGGVQMSYPVLWDELIVPCVKNKKEYFHFYQVGQVPPELFDVLKKENTWYSVDELNENNNILVDVYTVAGAIIPRDHVWVTFLYNRNVIVGIKYNRKLDLGTNKKTYFSGLQVDQKFNLDNIGLIFRTYSNAWFKDVAYRETSPDVTTPIYYNYGKIAGAADWGTFIHKNQIEIDNLYSHDLNYKNKIVRYRDGFITEDTGGFTDELLGKHVGIMYDDSIVTQELHELRHLNAFISDKHRGIRKYLLISKTLLTEPIYYWDDLDFYLVNTKSGKGIYINRVGWYAIGMVSHNCYAINADMIEDYIDVHDFLGSVDDCAIKIVYRQGGRKNGFRFQKYRVDELLKLEPEMVRDAMINTLSLVPEWQAARLEDSAYVSLMEQDSDWIDHNLIAEAYGYNGISHAFCNPIVPIKNGLINTPLVTRLKDRKTNRGIRSIFYYNKEGEYMGFSKDNTLTYELPIDEGYEDATHAEVFNIRATESLQSVWYNADVVDTDIKQYGYRCYVATYTSGRLQYDWADVTDKEGTWFYYDDGGLHGVPSIKWNWEFLTQASFIPLVKTNKEMFIVKHKKDASNSNLGYIAVGVKQMVKDGKGLDRYDIRVPFGNIDVFAGKLCLVENIDYYVKFPYIVITNQEVNKLEEVDILVRCYGSPHSDDLTNFGNREYGFAKGQILSADMQYNIRNYKNIRLIYDNKFVATHEKVTFAEDLVETVPNVFSEPNKPYAISDYVVPIEPLMNGFDTYDMYRETIDIDDRVSKYLTIYKPQQPVNNGFFDTHRWRVISPTTSAILHSFKNGVNWDANIPENYTIEDVANFMKKYKWLLDFDPAAKEVEENNFIIMPHAKDETMVVTQKQYEFLEWVINEYLHGKVDLSHHVTINNGD